MVVNAYKKITKVWIWYKFINPTEEIYSGWPQ